MQAIRFLDDWAYQANCRQMLDEPDVETLEKSMKFFQGKIEKFLKKSYNVSYKYPWNRLFEVEIEFS